MNTRIYIVTAIDDAKLKDRFIRAGSVAQATAHITKSMFTVRVAEPEELVDFLTAGGKVETAGETEK